MGTEVPALVAALVVVGLSCISYALADATRGPREVRVAPRPGRRRAYVPSVVVEASRNGSGSGGWCHPADRAGHIHGVPHAEVVSGKADAHVIRS